MALPRDLIRGLSHLLFPVLCEGCNRPLLQGEEVICMGCESHLARTDFHHVADNEAAMRLAGRVPFVKVTALGYFSGEGLLRHLIHGLKYRGKTQNGLYLGRELGRAIQSYHWGAELVVPVPLHPLKKAKRGYNQSCYIAEGVAAVLNVPLLEDAVVRTRFTESQTDKTRAERIQNVQGAFQPGKTEMLRGKHVLLVDDVLTTGATLEACANTLLQVPGVRISVAAAGIAN